MQTFRWLELISGLATGACGVGGVWYFLTAPLATACTGASDSAHTCVPASYLASNQNPDIVWLTVIVLVLFGWITLVAILDSFEVWGGRRWLWISTFVLAVIALLGVMTIGLFLLPGLGLALLTSILALIKRSSPHQTSTSGISI
jgi:hypothetical protein